MSEAPAPPPAPPKPRPAKPSPRTKPETKDKPHADQPRHWNVVLLDDDDHTYEYVIAMVQTLFAHPVQKALQIAKAVDTQGRAICLTTHKEHAELKRDQILAFGKDPFIASCKGSMSAIIEPADFGDDEGEGGGQDGRSGGHGGGNQN